MLDIEIAANTVKDEAELPFTVPVATEPDEDPVVEAEATDTALNETATKE